MPLVFTLCQTSFPARHALQSVTAFLSKVLVHTLLVGWGFFVCFTLHPIYSPLPLEGRNSEGKKNILFIEYTHTKGRNSMIMEKQSNSDFFTTERGASHAMWHLNYMNGTKAQEMAARRTCSYLQIYIAVESKF